MLAGLSRFRATAFLVKTIYATPPIIVEELAEQLEISRFQLIYDLANMSVFVRVNQSIKPEVSAFICKKYGYTLIVTPTQ
jgi:hypothetical protein